VRDTSTWRWRNAPVPEPHLVGLGLGIVLNVITSWRPAWPAWSRHGFGWTLILAGLWLAVWSVRAAAGVDMERPDRLVRGGPYAFSRNPMYLAWTLIYLGIALLVQIAWLLLLLPVVLLWTHLAIVREERRLECRFGTAYRGYKRSVRRYL
jgi:protein-S-isoprenylcysteine O-methyltransferase Ste14